MFPKQLGSWDDSSKIRYRGKIGGKIKSAMLARWQKGDFLHAERSYRMQTMHVTRLVTWLSFRASLFSHFDLPRFPAPEQKILFFCSGSRIIVTGPDIPGHLSSKRRCPETWLHARLCWDDQGSTFKFHFVSIYHADEIGFSWLLAGTKSNNFSATFDAMSSRF